jgi:hypothetical protein
MAYTTTRVCIYRAALPIGADAEASVARVEAAAAKVMAVNDKVVGVEVFPDAGDLVMRMEFRHFDQWMIRRKAPHVAVAILVQGGMDIGRTHLVDVMKPRDVPPPP